MQTLCTATFRGDYVSKSGNVTFRYAVTGKPEALAIFEDVQDIHHRVDEATGEYLWFTTRYCGDTATLIVNSDTGKIYPDMSEFRKQASLAKQFGGNLGDQIAQSAVSKLFRKTEQPATAPANA